MVTSIAVRDAGSYGAEDRSWTIGEHGFDMTENVALDFNTFTGANFADGYIRSGCVLARITATGKWGPFDPAATDGRQNAEDVVFLFNTTKIPANKSELASDAGLWHFQCREARLPYKTGPGAAVAAVKTATKQRVRYL